MASLFEDMMAEAGLSALMPTLGDQDTITYQAIDQGADPVTLTAIVGAMTDEGLAPDPHGQRLPRSRTVTISTDPTSEWSGVAAPQIGATFTIDGDVWSITDTIRRLPGAFSVLRCESRPLAEVSRPGYRTE